VPAFCPTCPHRAVQFRIDPDGKVRLCRAEQGRCGAGGSNRTDPDEPHPAENCKVGGSIPPLPTTFPEVSGLPAGLSWLSMLAFRSVVSVLMRFVGGSFSTELKPGPAGRRLAAAVLGRRHPFGCRYGMHALITISSPHRYGEP
jgi:hypothetical protein